MANGVYEQEEDDSVRVTKRRDKTATHDSSITALTEIP
jgi:hypothetical protein